MCVILSDIGAEFLRDYMALKLDLGRLSEQTRAEKLTYVEFCEKLGEFRLAGHVCPGGSLFRRHFVRLQRCWTPGSGFDKDAAAEVVADMWSTLNKVFEESTLAAGLGGVPLMPVDQLSSPRSRPYHLDGKDRHGGVVLTVVRSPLVRRLSDGSGRVVSVRFPLAATAQVVGAKRGTQVSKMRFSV